MPLVYAHLSGPEPPPVSASTVTITGTVVNDVGDPLSRLVLAFFTNGPAAGAVGQTRSNLSDGSFSFTLPGTSATEFAFVVHGELGENWVVHSHKKAA